MYFSLFQHFKFHPSTNRRTFKSSKSLFSTNNFILPAIVVSRLNPRDFSTLISLVQIHIISHTEAHTHFMYEINISAFIVYLLVCYIQQSVYGLIMDRCVSKRGGGGSGAASPHIGLRISLQNVRLPALHTCPTEDRRFRIKMIVMWCYLVRLEWITFTPKHTYAYLRAS